MPETDERVVATELMESFEPLRPLSYSGCEGASDGLLGGRLGAGCPDGLLGGKAGLGDACSDFVEFLVGRGGRAMLLDWPPSGWFPIGRLVMSPLSTICGTFAFGCRFGLAGKSGLGGGGGRGLALVFLVPLVD